MMRRMSVTRVAALVVSVSALSASSVTASCPASCEEDTATTLSTMPDLNGKTCLCFADLGTFDGDLIVDGSAVNVVSWTIEQLAFPQLTSVTGKVEIRNSPDLHTVDLSRVTSIGGELYVAYNDVIQTFDISSLTSIGGTITFEENYELSSLGSVPAFGGLTSVGGDISIYENPFTGVLDFSGLTAPVNGFVDIYDTSATAVDLRNVPEITGSLYISSNSVLTSLQLCSLTSVGGDTTIKDNDGSIECGGPAAVVPTSASVTVSCSACPTPTAELTKTTTRSTPPTKTKTVTTTVEPTQTATVVPIHTTTKTANPTTTTTTTAPASTTTTTAVPITDGSTTTTTLPGATLTSSVSSTSSVFSGNMTELIGSGVSAATTTSIMAVLTIALLL